MIEQKRQVVARSRTGPSGAGPAPVASGLSLTPKDIFDILLRHVWLIIILTFMGMLLGGTSWYLLRKYKPKYTARTVMRVLPPTEKNPMVIGSAQVNKDLQYGHRQTMVSLLLQQSNLERLLEREKIQQTVWFRRFGEIRDKRIKKAFKSLKKNFSASAQRDGDFIVVSMTCGSKDESAGIVNEMVRMFVASQGSSKKEEVTKKLSGFEDQRLRVQRDLDNAEDSMEDVRNASGFSDLGSTRDYQDVTTQKLSNLELEQNDLVINIRQLQSSIESLERQATGPINEQVENLIERDPIMLNLAQRVAAQEGQLAASLTKFGENHKVIIQLRELIEETKAKRKARKAEVAEITRQSNLKNAKDALVSLQNQFEELEKMRSRVAEDKRKRDIARIQYAKVEAVRDERRARLDEVKQMIESHKIILKDPETPKVQFVAFAPPPLDISSPKIIVYVPGGTMLGGMLAVGLAFLIELLNDKVRSPREVAKNLNIPILGVIPHAIEDEQVDNVDLCHVVRQAPYSIISESYRRFRTNFKLSNPDEDKKTILVSSGTAGDGKTTIAVNLATSLVAENKKVLLVESNFWMPKFYEVFPDFEGADDQQQPKVGLSSILSGNMGCEEVIRNTGIENFDVIDAGPLPSNPAEMLGGDQMGRLIEAQREVYDFVIIDAPPILLVSDTKMLAKLVDGTILVFNADFTRKGAAQRTIRELKQVEANIFGCVLLAVKSLKGGYFREQFKSYREYQKLQLSRAI